MAIFKNPMRIILQKLAANSASHHIEEAQAYRHTIRRIDSKIATLKARTPARTRAAQDRRRSDIRALQTKRESFRREAVRRTQLARQYLAKAAAQRTGTAGARPRTMRRAAPIRRRR